MRPKVIVLVALCVSIPLALVARAVADVSADAGGDTITVGASSSAVSGGVPGHPSAGGGGRPGPACTYTLLPASDQAALGRGGPTPGFWYTLDCAGPTLGLYPGGVVWLAASPQPAAAPVGPSALLAQALKSLVLPPPQIHLDPAGFSVVNLATWLWVEPQIWHPWNATATAGSISATAIATPHDVVWEMGDESSVVCAGPGDPYQANRPASGQQTYCSYAFRQPSIGQPSTTGDPNDGAFPVTATITWTVTWFAVGAPGGGTLPSLHTTSTVAVRVEQVESIGTTP